MKFCTGTSIISQSPCWIILASIAICQSDCNNVAYEAVLNSSSVYKAATYCACKVGWLLAVYFEREREKEKMGVFVCVCVCVCVCVKKEERERSDSDHSIP